MTYSFDDYDSRRLEPLHGERSVRDLPAPSRRTSSSSALSSQPNPQVTAAMGTARRHHVELAAIVVLGLLAITVLAEASFLIEPVSETRASSFTFDDVNASLPERNGDRRLQTYTQGDDFQSLMLAAVNAERAKVGLSALCTNSKLQAAAQGHSNDMARNNYMSHTGADGSSISQRITAQGYSWSAIAENVAAGQVDVAAVMTAWMNSDGHKANILSSKYTHFGTGYAYSSSSTYKHYWTQDFGTSSSESCAGSSTTTKAPATTTPTPTTRSPSPAPTTAKPTTTSATVSSSVQAKMLAAINAERAKVGVAALCTNSKLQSAAQGHSNDMVRNNYMSHTGADGSSMSQRITAAGYKWTAVAENVAAGQVDVTAVMKSWMSSSSHKANILSAKYKHFGMGYAYSSSTTYKHYWTQDFGTGSSESCS